MRDEHSYTREELAVNFSASIGLDATTGMDHAVMFREVWTRSGLNASVFADRLAAYLDLPRLGYESLASATPLAARFSPRFLREFGAYPFLDVKGIATVAVAEPPEASFLRAAEIVLSIRPQLAIVSYDDIEIILNDRLDGQNADPSTIVGDSGAASDDVENLRDLASGAPVVRALNDLFDKAVEARATDLHVEPMRDALSIRLRIDGILRNTPAPPARMAAAIISRIKILAGLNIAERRLPQDGSARLRVAGNQIDVRVAIMPSAHGESAVIRFLPRDRGLLDIARIGMSSRNEAIMRRLLQLRNGMIIITGPTGSGKTTTLAGALSFLNEASRKILTIEDPIEYELNGVVQAQVNASIGLTFANALRAFLRLDPNVIMVGEIRDGETAGIAVQAALTGHLVLTTLHTETAAAAVPRLIDLGVEDFLLQSTVRALVAQRLIRVLCDHCKKPMTLDQAEIDREPTYELLGLGVGERVWEPVGCDRCGGNGYRGRRGVFEILEITPRLRQAIRRGVDSPSLEAMAREGGFRTLMEDAAEQCRAGETSASEVLRVTSAR
jgi:general secretion pathway protein E